MLMMGYAFDHPSGTYEMFNPATDTIIISNSVQWSSFSRWDVQASDPAVGKVLQSLSIRPSVIVDDPIRSPPHVNFANNPPQVIADDATAVSFAAKSHSLSLDTLDSASVDDIGHSPRCTRSQGFLPPPMVTVSDPNV